MVSFHALGPHPLDDVMPPAGTPNQAGHLAHATSKGAAAAMAGRLGVDLWQAVEQRQLRLVYQPAVDLKSGALAGLEALARWQHPHHGLLMPDFFIPLAEESGAIVPLGAWVVEEACRQMHRWQARFPALRGLAISVNLSPVELQQPDLHRRVASTLRDTDLEPGSLSLEITETAMISDAESTLRTLRTLRGLGTRLALDDFGTGFSSLNYLRRFPVDTLKIDRAFVQELGSSASSLAIVRAVVSLAHALEMNVIAEGFETPQQLARLRDAYCDQGQGFYFSEPLTPEQMDQLLFSVMN